MMSKPFFIVKLLLLFLIIHTASEAAALLDKTDKSPIIITSESLTADNKNNKAVFEGSVKAKTDNMSMFSDRMTVFYDSSKGKIKKIHAAGNVKVLKENKTLFSDEALYIEQDNTITFTGNPRAIEGSNVISGSKILFHLQDESVVVEQSRVILQNSHGIR